MKENKRYGKYGGVYMPELLMAPISQLTDAFNTCKTNTQFLSNLNDLLNQYAGRPTPLTEIKRFSKGLAKPAHQPRIFLKREDLLHTGAHKINNALGQCLLACAMEKTRIIAETGAGQHGVATATACAHLGLKCVIYMGKKDMERQAPNVLKMQLLGAEIIPVLDGAQTLKDAVNAALRDWAESFDDTHYCLGSALGPHPYPQMVAFFQKVIGEETLQQCSDQYQQNPDAIIACVGGGSNAIGIFQAFLNTGVELIGVEAGGKGAETHLHAARFLSGRPGVLHGCYTYLLQDENGQVLETHSISAGLDYPAVGPEHAFLFEQKRVHYTHATDEEALVAFKLLAQTEGIIPALESAHALAYVIKAIKQNKWNDQQLIVINLSGRGDKDLSNLI